jgi:hypothetical protein
MQHAALTLASAAQVFDSADGGRAKLDALDLKLSKLEGTAHANALTKHGRGHAGQQLRRSPLLPFHHVVFDPMHAVHNEANVLLDEAVHKHLMVESSDPQVKKVIDAAQSKINALWKAAQLPKFIQFGRDKQGAHSHALNGPAFKAIWRQPDLLIKTIDLMRPVYALLESRKAVPPLQPDAVGEQADIGPAASRKAGEGGKKKKAAPKKSTKRRSALWDDDEGEATSAPSGAGAAGVTSAPGESCVRQILPYLVPICSYDMMT